MVASGAAVRLEELARDLFEFITRVGLAIPRTRRPAADLKESEFLTLALLHERGTMIVGDIQRQLGVLPAQMSRVLRSLEARDRPLIACHINPRDKRKIDVCLTPAGEKALFEYEAVWVQRIIELLGDLTEEDREELGRLVEKLRGRQVPQLR
jgi:DNA-binding MarR family transcriptional regulator